MDDPVNNPTLLTITGKPEVTLKLPNGATQKFASMQDLANFSDSLRGMVEGWRGSEEQEKLEGARRAIYEIVIEGMRRQIAEVNPEAAKAFPDQVLVGAGFIVDAVEVDEGFRVSVEMHVRSIILLVANILASVKKVEKQPGFALSEEEWARLNNVLEDVHSFMALVGDTDVFTEAAYKLLPHWIKVTGAFASGVDPRVAPKSKQPQVDVREVAENLDKHCLYCDDTGMMELFGETPAPQFTNCHCPKGRED